MRSLISKLAVNTAAGAGASKLCLRTGLTKFVNLPLSVTHNEGP